MTWILVLLLLLCALYLLFLYGIFRLVFWNSDARKKEGPHSPRGPGMMTAGKRWRHWSI